MREFGTKPFQETRQNLFLRHTMTVFLFKEPMTENNKGFIFVCGIFILAYLLNSIAAFAFDTYLFRVKIDSTTRKSDIETIFSTKGRGKSEAQPFHGTHVLSQADTNYVLVKLTPKDADEKLLADDIFGLTGSDLYRQYSLKMNSGLVLIRDNSAKFPVNKNWSAP